MSSEQVYIVDDDPDVREATSFLVTTAGYAAESFETPEALLDRIARDSAGCLILDVRLPGMNGLELQRELAERQIRMPIIFITGHGDIPMAVEAVNAGALDFLEKPFDNDALLARVEEAVLADRERRTREAASAEIDQRLERLTPREREVMEGILAGKLNKVIGYELDMSTRTVEVHRGRILDKLGARNAPEMVRLVLAGQRYHDWSPPTGDTGHSRHSTSRVMKNRPHAEPRRTPSDREQARSHSARQPVIACQNLWERACSRSWCEPAGHVRFFARPAHQRAFHALPFDPSLRRVFRKPPDRAADLVAYGLDPGVRADVFHVSTRTATTDDQHARFTGFGDLEVVFADHRERALSGERRHECRGEQRGSEAGSTGVTTIFGLHDIDLLRLE